MAWFIPPIYIWNVPVQLPPFNVMAWIDREVRSGLALSFKQDRDLLPGHIVDHQPDNTAARIP